ncbi:MAG TPA: TIGR01841 family phasin, partial [Paraburkholderia sp.]|nr:TIGR01841 family phasin [Paraburkholderia sp.]
TKALSTSNPSELFALPTTLSQPAAEKVTSYSRQVHEILSGIQSEFLKTATELFQQSQKEGQAFVESLAKNAPAGSEGTIAAWNTAFSAINSTYESANKAAKQFVATVSAAA